MFSAELESSAASSDFSRSAPATSRALTGAFTEAMALITSGPIAFSSTDLESFVGGRPFPDCHPPSILLCDMCCVCRVIRVSGAESVVRCVKRSVWGRRMRREKTEYIESKARARARIGTRRTLEVMYVVPGLALFRYGVEMSMSVERIYMVAFKFSSSNGSRYMISGTAYPPAQASRKSPNTSYSAPNFVETSHTITAVLAPNNSQKARSVFIRNN